MSGTVKQFVDFTNNTASDTGENTATSIQRIDNGETLDETVLRRPSESLRQRTEALKNAEGDSLYLRDADRKFVVTGPGKITWPGSTTAVQTGIPIATDTIYLLPMLTPGFAQTPPVPPVASAYGVIHLKRATGPSNAIAVRSLRRSYAAGDQISIVVTAGSVFSCTLDTESGYERTIHIVATGATQLSTVITALGALTPTAPDNTALVSAALEGGALGTDLILTTQAKQYMSGNYDGEGHAITPANLAAFFTGSPASALAEGDSLCVEYTMVSDTASTGGRRQAIPENANTAVPVGSFFNSRVNPEKLVNALPICKVVNGRLVFDTGVEVPAGSTGFDLAGETAANVSYAGGGTWADGTTNPATTVEGQLDKIITDLGGTGGASKIKYDGGGTWADGTTNPAATVEQQLDKVITDLAGAAGTGKVQGSVVGTDLAAATLAVQLADLAVNWLKMGRANTIAGAQTFSALITATLGLTAAANQHITVSGSGRFKHGTRTLTMHWSAGEPCAPAGTTPPANVTTDPAYVTQNTGPGWMFPIALPAGKRILEVRVLLKDPVGNAVLVELDEYTGSTSPATQLATALSAGSNAIQTITLAAVNYTMVASKSYVVWVNGSFAAATHIYKAEIDYDEP